MGNTVHTVKIPIQGRVDRRHLLRSTALQAMTILAFAVPGATRAQAPPAPNARPQGGQVVAGTAAISNAPTSTTINQSSSRAAIDWRSFDVGRNQSVIFQQPNSAAITLNRVTGPDPSTIAGRISANGQIVLVNPSGVTFHQGSQVNAQSIVVSAAGISNQNFMAGRMMFDQTARPNARIQNRGTITVKEAGLAALVAPSVANSGVISARMGHVVLAGAAAHTLDLYGDGLVSIDVTQQVRQAPVGPDGKVVTALVTNSGTIAADGGTVVLTARAADGIVQNLVRAGGSIRADTTSGQTGRIEIAGTGGSVVIEGRVAADGRVPGATGGSIAVAGSGATVVGPTASITANGWSGGGTVALGTTLARATSGRPTPPGPSARTVIAAGARVSADATSAGNGGRVTVLSTQSTSVAGTITARGGPTSGNGGTVELSGNAGFRLTGHANTSAPHGAVGTIVLDPRDLTVTAAPAGTNLAPANGADPNIAADAGGTTTDAYVTPAQIQALSGNVRLQATRDLTVASDLLYTGGSNLTLEAGRNLTVNAGVTVSVPVFFTASALISSIVTLTAAAPGIVGRDPAGTLQVLGNLSASGLVLSAGTGGIVMAGKLFTRQGGVNSTTVATTGSVVQTGGSLITGNLSGTAASLSLPQAANQVRGVGAAGTQFTTTSGGALITTSAPLTIGGTASLPGGLTVPTGQTVVIQADTLNLLSGGGPALSAPGGSVTLSPLTTSQNILISATANAAAGLTTYTPAQLGLVQASTLRLGLGSLSTGAITFGATATDPVDLVTNGNFAQVFLATSGSVQQNGTLTVNALAGGGSSIILNSTANQIAAIGGLRAVGPLQIVTASDLAVSGTNSAGDTLSLAAGGALSLAGTGSIRGPDGLSLSAGTALTLPGTVASNQSVSLSAGTDGISLSGIIQPGQNLFISTTGPVTQTGGAISGGNLSGTAASVSLPSRQNALSGLGLNQSVNVTGASGDFLLVNSTALSVGGTNPDMEVSGGLALQSGRTATFVTDSLAIIASTGAPNVSVPGGTIVIAPYTSGGAILLTSGTKPAGGLSLTTTEAKGLKAATLQLGTLASGAPTAGDITLGRAGEAIDLSTTGFTNLAVLSSGTVTQGGALTLPGTISGQAGALNLPSSGNAIQGLGGFITTAGDITLHTSTGLTVSGSVVATGGAGDVSLSSSGLIPNGASTSMLLTGDITGKTVSLNTPTDRPPLNFYAGITQSAGTVTASTLTGSGGFLSLTSNNQITALSDFGVYGPLSVSNGRALVITGAVSSSNAGVTLNTQGLTQTASSSISTSELNGSSFGDTVLDSRNNAVGGIGTFVQNVGNFTLVTSSPQLLFGTNSGTLMAAAGSFTFVADGVGLVGEPIGTTAITAANGAVTFAPFTASRRIELIGNTAADPASLSVSQSLISRITTMRLGLGAADTTGPVNIANANETVDLTGHARSLQLRTTGTVTEGISPGGQDGRGTLGLAVVNLKGSTGNLTLDAPTNAIQTIGVGDGVVGGVDGLAAAGSLTVKSELSLRVANTVTASSPSGTLTISSAGALQSIGTVSGGIVGLEALGGPLSQDAGTIIAAGALSLTAPGQTVNQLGGTITAGTLAGSAASMTLGRTGNRVGTLSGLVTTGTFTLTDRQSLSVAGPFLAGDANLVVAGNMTLLGTVRVPGTVAISATGTFTQPAGSISAGTLTGSAGSVSLVASGNGVKQLGGFSTPGTFTLINGQDLTVAGPLVAASAGLTVTGGLTLSGPVTVPGTLALAALGAITQPGGTITAGTLTGSAASATLNRGNTIATLGQFTSTGGFALTDGQSLAVAGPVSAASANLTVTGDLALAGTITVPGTLTLAATGAITQPGGTITAGTLAGTATSAAIGQTNNSIATLAGFTTTGDFALTDGRSLIVTQPVDPTVIRLTVRGDLALNTSVTGGTVVLDVTGAITEGPGGQVVATTLAGNGASAVLAGDNRVGTLGTFAVATGLVFDNGQSLSIAGPVSGGQSVEIAAAGPLLVSGTVVAPSIALRSTGSIAQAGASAVTADALTLTAKGSVSVAGSVSAGTLAVATSAALVQTGGNLAVGILTGTAGSIDLGQAGAARIDGIANLAANSTAVVVSQGPLRVSGTVAAPVLAITATGTMTLDGGIIRTDGLPIPTQSGVGQAVSGSVLAVRPGLDGTAVLRQLGTTDIVPFSGRLAALRLALPASGGTLVLNTLRAPTTDLVLGLGSGTAVGNLTANNLTLVGTGGPATLTGAVLGRTDGTAAQVARAEPQINPSYTFNGCVVAAISCSVSPPIVTPVQPSTGQGSAANGTTVQPDAAIASILRPDILSPDALDLSVTRDPDDPTQLLPNISDRDY